MKPKKYKNQSITGQRGVNLIEKVVLDMGFVWTPTNLEAGIDGTIEIRDRETEEATNFIMQVQSKASKDKYIPNAERKFTYICNERDLNYWLKGNCPVLLICVNVETGEAHWVSVKDYFNSSIKVKERKVTFENPKHLFSVNCRDELSKIAISKDSGIYLSPPPKEEHLYSNLLKISKLPDRIYFAKTKYRKGNELWSALNLLADKKGINKSWILKDGKIYSFNNLDLSPWKNFVSAKTIDSIPTPKWQSSNDYIIKRYFVELLYNSFETLVYKKKILHKKNKKVNLYYFRPQLDHEGLPKSRKIRYNRLGRNSKQGVCERYYRKSDPSIISYYRHLAFEIHFYKFGEVWYLEITPTYYFTHDGFKLHTYYESKLKGKKGLDKPETVFSETLFWADILTRGKTGMFSNDFMEFEFLEHVTVNFGLDDKQWLAKEDQEKSKILSNQKSLFEHED